MGCAFSGTSVGSIGRRDWVRLGWCGSTTGLVSSCSVGVPCRSGGDGVAGRVDTREPKGRRLGGEMMWRRWSHQLMRQVHGRTCSVVSVDRSGLMGITVDTDKTSAPPPGSDTPLTRHVASLIRFRGGPLTLAEFMHEAMTHPKHGYYTQGDVFGSKGDFITSPEVSQMMGELMGIWALCAWQQAGQPKKFRLVEIGPGRGTMMADLLRATSTFREFVNALTVHLVEVSKPMRRLQWTMLRCQTLREHFGDDAGPNADTEDVGISFVSGATVHWHADLDEVPDGPSVILAHELLDALPAHRFMKTERGWREVLVDVFDHEVGGEAPCALRFVLAPGETPASRLLLPSRLKALDPEAVAKLGAIEVSARAMAYSQKIATRVQVQGGAALLIDYGKDGPHESSLKAIKDHKFVDALHAPGKTDLSVDVDFSAIRQAVEEQGSGSDNKAMLHGPVTQASLLHSLGIRTRLESLLQHASEEQKESLLAGFRRLVDSAEHGGMGDKYMAVAITRMNAPTPIAFEEAA